MFQLFYCCTYFLFFQNDKSDFERYAVSWKLAETLKGMWGRISDSKRSVEHPYQLFNGVPPPGGHMAAPHNHVLVMKLIQSYGTVCWQVLELSFGFKILIWTIFNPNLFQLVQI